MATDQTQADYQALVDRIADGEPHTGFHSILQITLSDADTAVVVRHEPDVLQDCLTPVTDYIRRETDRAFDESDENARASRLGRMLMACLKTECKQLVLQDVREECDRRESEQEALAERARRGDVGAALTAMGEV